MELQPAVAAVDRNALEEVVEGGAAHLCQGVARALERQAIADVLVNKGEATEWMWRDGQQQSAAIGQMKQLLLRPHDRGEQPLLLALECPEIGGLGETTSLPEPFQNFLEGWLSSEPVLCD